MQRVIRAVTPLAPPLPRLVRAAAYARVSSGKDAMLHSLSSQVSYYSKYIQQHRGWEYAGVFVDEALTGTKDTRQGFQDLLAACRAGKIDLVLTKSISRFARNTVTLLEVVRELKELGVDVYFERENIHSMSEDGELMLTILASYAQEESRSASENCKWRIRKRFEEGELVSLRFMYGYRIVKGIVEIAPTEAEVVREMFADYIGGMGGGAIAKKLRAGGVPCLRGGNWNSERVLAMIKNEKYTGNALLQKKFVVDHIAKKEVWNKGQLPQYYAEETHPAIVDMETYEMAQEIMELRRRRVKSRRGVTPRQYPFTSKIVCGGCGKNYKRKTTAGKPYWQCSTFLHEGKDACGARQIPEDILQDAAADALGLDAFDAAVFAERVQEIRIPDGNTLVFVFFDGGSATCEWEYRSRSESWDDDMRRAARERMTPEFREASRQRMHAINRQRRRRA